MLHDTIREQMKEAMKAREELRLSVLRGLITAFTNELVATLRKPDEKLTDEQALAVIKRGVKQREDSIEQFTKGNRPELADKESKELAILKAYLPATMPKDDIRKITQAKMKALGVTDKKDMGKLMGAVIRETKGAADGKDVKEVVESLLACSPTPD